MIIFGKDERVKFEAIRDTLSNAVVGNMMKPKPIMMENG